jgi:hypothetical protein
VGTLSTISEEQRLLYADELAFALEDADHRRQVRSPANVDNRVEAGEVGNTEMA